MSAQSTQAWVMRSWTALKPELAGWIIDAVLSMGFERMTPVQASAIPLFLGHKDVVVEAVTGSGKTLAFLIPILQRLYELEERCKPHHVGAIIVSPTRELATQIYGVLQYLMSFESLSSDSTADLDDAIGGDAVPKTKPSKMVISQLLVGGRQTPPQDLDYFLQVSPNILVSTPGRLLDLLSSSKVKCTQASFEMLVLDEADRLLDMGFKDDLQKILAKLPKQRRTGLFSASVSEAIDQLVRVGLRNPVKVSVKVKGSTGKEDQRTPTSLQMRYLAMPASQKIPSLCSLLANMDPMPAKIIVYLSTCAAVDYFQHVLPAVLKKQVGDIILMPLHGKHPPQVRQKNFRTFCNTPGAVVLLTTDVAARGLDIPQVDLVVQIDPPSDPKVFLHRCGRAGRAGRKGLAVLFLHSGREEDYVHFLAVRKTPVQLLRRPEVKLTPEKSQITTKNIREQVIRDRALHEKAQKGFVSWVMSYGKHHAKSIFRIQDLDWNDLADAWGLLKMPSMPELRNWKGSRALGLAVDFDEYAYRDKQRERARKVLLGGNTGSTPSRAKPRMQEKRSWSEKHDRKEERNKRRIKRHKQQERQKWLQMTSSQRQQQTELQGMIEEVKNNGNILADEEFHGFD